MTAQNDPAECCFRCGAELPRTAGECRWCAQCGAPQLLLAESARLPMESVTAHTTGAIPPPRPGCADWRAVLEAALLVAGVGAVLTGLGFAVAPLGALGTLWLLGSGVAGAWLYRRLRPGLRMDGYVGVRVGLVAGCLTVALVAAVLTTGALVERFALHRGAAMDAVVTHVVDTAAQAQKEAAARPAPGNLPQPAPLGPELLVLLQTPAGRAGYLLLAFAVDAVLLIALSAAGGALAGSLAWRRSRVGRLL